MIGIANIRKLKGLDDINEAYGIKDKPVKENAKPSQPVPAKKNAKAGKKPLNKKSSKKKAVDKELKKLAPIFLAKHPNCEIKSPVCTGAATIVHHRKGRGKVDVTNVKTFVASCPPCNGWVESNDKKARDQGHKVSKF